MRLSPILTMALLLVGPIVSAQDSAQPPAQAAAKKSDTAATEAPAPATTMNAEYKIGPQDMLRVDVWREPEISRTIPVRPDGKISLPLLNDVQAAGLTPMQLADSIRDGLTKYISGPQVTVTVTEINSRRVFLTGEVARPGALALLPNMTVLQALSSGGGFTQFAKLKNIYVLRVENGKQIKHAFNYKEVVKGKNQEENIPLQAGDVIVVP